MPAESILRTSGNEGGGGGAEFPDRSGGVTELAAWLLKDLRGGGAGSRTRGAPFFDCFASSLLLSKLRNFSFSTKNDFGPD